MTKIAFFILTSLHVLSAELLAQESVHEIDLEVINLLNLTHQEAIAYSAIMQQQRAVYRIQNPRGWEQQLAFYQKTFDRLKPILTTEQHIRFVAYMDSFLEEIPVDEMIAME